MKVITEAASKVFRLSRALNGGPIHYAIMIAHNSVVDLDEYQFLDDIVDDAEAIIEAFHRDVSVIPGHNAWIVDPVAKVLEDLLRDVEYARAYGE